MSAAGTQGAWWMAYFPTSQVQVKKVQVTTPNDSSSVTYAANAKVFIGAELCGTLDPTPVMG